MTQPLPFRLMLVGGEDTDRDDGARLLRQELLDSSQYDVDFGREEHAPDGARGEPITIGVLLVAAIPAAIPGLFAIVQGWLKRRRYQSVRVKVGDIEVEVSGDTPCDELDKIIKTVRSVAASDKANSNSAQ